MGIADDLLLDGIAPLAVVIRDFDAKPGGPEAFHFGPHITAFVVEEALTIANQVLQVADLRRVDGGVITFCDDAVGQRVPQSTGGRVGGSNRVFGASRPARRNARSAGRRILEGHNDGNCSGCGCEKVQAPKSVPLVGVSRLNITNWVKERGLLSGSSSGISVELLEVP